MVFSRNSLLILSRYYIYICVNFTNQIRTNYADISIEDYFDGCCPSCKSRDLKIRSSRKRIIPDLGTPIESRFNRIEIKTFECKACKCTFTPKHPDYPPKLEYSPSIIRYSLDRFYKNNSTGNEISADLKKLHNVDIPVDTIHSWIKIYSEDYLNSVIQSKPKEDPLPIKTITIDGTFTSVGKDVVGKKPRAAFLSVSREKNGTYLIILSKKKV